MIGFFIGFIIGGLFGMVVMACICVASDDDDYNE